MIGVHRNGPCYKKNNVMKGNLLKNTGNESDPGMVIFLQNFLAEFHGNVSNVQINVIMRCVIKGLHCILILGSMIGRL